MQNETDHPTAGAAVEHTQNPMHKPRKLNKDEHKTEKNKTVKTRVQTSAQTRVSIKEEHVERKNVSDQTAFWRRKRDLPPSVSK